MRTLIVIPARYMSTRFEGKPLALIRDKYGIEKTLIERTWDSAKKVVGHVRSTVKKPC